MAADLQERRLDRCRGRRYIPPRSERSEWPGGETGRSAGGPDGGRKRPPEDLGAPGTPGGRRGRKVTPSEGVLDAGEGRKAQPAARGDVARRTGGGPSPGTDEGREARGQVHRDRGMAARPNGDP